MKLKQLIYFIFLSISSFSQTGGIKGTTLTNKGEVLPFVGIYVKELKSGVASNIDGYFEMKLPEGDYTLVFHCLGYANENQKIRIEKDKVELNIILKEVSYNLGEIKIGKNTEDPAYTIMRKAISMAKFYEHQLLEYSADVYMRGNAKLNDLPWLIEKLANKQDKAEIEKIKQKIFFVESTSQIFFKHPNTFKERVLSVRSNFEDSLPSPVGYINSSFYKPLVNKAVSPLSPKAFSYYSFKFEGSYFDGVHQINKIRVTPKSKGDNLFEGTINILENLWSIQSVSLKVKKEGINAIINQVYLEVQDKIWLPVAHSYVLSGSPLGIDFEAKYHATTKNYKIKINEKVAPPKELIDIKSEPEKAAEVTKVKARQEEDFEKILSGEKKLSLRGMRKMMKAYEKEEEKKQESADILEDNTLEVDSSAYGKDSLYWANVRSIPLSFEEQRDYTIKDTSITGASKDTTASKGKKSKSFNWGFIFNTQTIKIDSSQSIEILSPIAGLEFNTVEGYVLNLRTEYRKKCKNGKRFIVAPTGRYSFAREKYSGKAKIQYEYGSKHKPGSLYLEGGLFVSQLNSRNPIIHYINSLYTLMGERSYAKLYEKQYLQLGIDKAVSDKFSFSFSSELASRYQLFNSPTAKPWFDYKERAFTSNSPYSEELQLTTFSNYTALTSFAEIKYQPWKKYRIVNGKKESIEKQLTELSFSYTKGWNAILGSSVDFDLVQAGITTTRQIGIRATLDLGCRGGFFINNRKMNFPDYNHFMGNQTIIQPNLLGYRLLPYYKYSTNNYFVQASAHFQTRKFLFSQIAYIRDKAIKENLFCSYLYTSTSNSYYELGYGIDNIVRIFRVELVSSFSNTTFNQFGIRIGINSAFLDSNE
ncbi:MAG: carboxypeptidase-like regulatory domain-containing protein [Bacteroidetes bacterium]|nr:carboxypeptidase-like regulatory domain-containing protein [Bacteroidota bacterium]